MQKIRATGSIWPQSQTSLWRSGDCERNLNKGRTRTALDMRARHGKIVRLMLLNQKIRTHRCNTRASSFTGPWGQNGRLHPSFFMLNASTFMATCSVEEVGGDRIIPLLQREARNPHPLLDRALRQHVLHVLRERNATTLMPPHPKNISI